MYSNVTKQYAAGMSTIQIVSVDVINQSGAIFGYPSRSKYYLKNPWLAALSTKF